MESEVMSFTRNGWAIAAGMFPGHEATPASAFALRRKVISTGIDPNSQAETKWLPRNTAFADALFDAASVSPNSFELSTAAIAPP